MSHLASTHSQIYTYKLPSLSVQTLNCMALLHFCVHPYIHSSIHPCAYFPPNFSDGVHTHTQSVAANISNVSGLAEKHHAFS